jgi:uncharacterized membrane protein (DUF2068 family)
MSELKEKLSAEVHRPDFGLRVIIVWKIIKSALLVGLAISAFALVHSDLHALGTRVVTWLGIDPAGPRVGRFLVMLAGMTPKRVAAIGIGALLYAAVLGVEAWGLHRRRAWAEWLTIIVTSSLIPLEIYELARHPSTGKVLTLIANVAIVIYLGRHRFLFFPPRRR